MILAVAFWEEVFGTTAAYLCAIFGFALIWGGGRFIGSKLPKWARYTIAICILIPGPVIIALAIWFRRH